MTALLQDKNIVIHGAGVAALDEHAVNVTCGMLSP